MSRNKKPELIDYGNGRTSIFDDYDLKISKTELKKSMQRLQDIAVPLTQMSKKNIKSLPASEEFIDGLLELNTINSKEAKRRQLQRIGKLFREEPDANVHAIINTLYEHTFSPEQRGKFDTWHTRFIEQGDPIIKTFCKQYRSAESNTINQYLIHYEYAGDMNDDQGQEVATLKLAMYVQQILILEAKK